MKSGKRYMTDGMELPIKDKIRMHGEKGIYKYLEADTIKQEEIKDKIKERLSQENDKGNRHQTIK